MGVCARESTGGEVACVGAPGTEVSCSFELQDMGSGNQTWVLSEISEHS